MKLNKLIAASERTRDKFESILGNRGCTTGLKKWELEILWLAYEALDTPTDERLFDLDKITNLKQITKQRL